MKVYIVYTCNEWKERSSMSAYWVGTNWNKCMNAIKRGVADGTFYFDGNDDRKDAAREFATRMKEVDTSLHSNQKHLIDSLVELCYIEECENNSLV